MRRHRGLVAVVAAVAVWGVGCGSSEQDAVRNTPEEALRGFYEASFRDRDFGRACRFAAPGFHLRPTRLVGVNVGEGDPAPDVGRVRTEPRRGPCPALAGRVQAKRGDQYPWSAWSVESVRIADDDRTAQAVTEDGSAGLRVVEDEWRVAWVFDSP